MEGLKKTLTILNLSGELSSEFSGYLSSRNVQVIDPSNQAGSEEWTHILTKDIHDFDEINSTYQVLELNRHIISLSKPNDLQNFTMNNGNLVLNDLWFQGPMGPFIVDKYFQGYGGISLGDNYPTFKELGSFNVANPFNTGEYLDRMVQKAFESGIEALTVKTYFDHLVMYVAGLKKKGKAGLPFEVTYGTFENIFAVQVHFFSQQLEMLDVTTSLSSTLTRKAEEYFLNVSVQSTDFFDFTHMPEVNKVVVTGLWNQDERLTFESRGCMFTSLTGGAAVTQYEMEGATSVLVSASPMEDYSDKIVIPDSLPEEVFTTVVKGSQPEEELVSVVSGTPQEIEAAQIIKGDKELEELVQTIKGKFEEDKTVTRLSGNKLDVDKTAYRIAATVDQSAKETNLKVRSIGDKLPDSIKTGLYDFAKIKNKEVEDLDDSDLEQFQMQRVPAIIKAGMTPAKKVFEKSVEEKKDMLVQSLGNANPSQFIPQNNEAMKLLESRLMTANTDNEKLKTQLKAMTSEVRILKESRTKLAEIQLKATQAASEINIKTDDQDDALRKHFQQKLSDQKVLNETEVKKLSALLDRESKLIADVKQEELKARKIQIEALQKENFFSQELEKSERQVKAKDLILIKTKETFTKLLEKKDRDIEDVKTKNDQLSKALASGPATTQVLVIKDLEKQNQNLIKQLEVYKVKISSLANNMQTTKTDDNFKDEARKLGMLNQQLKNQLDLSKKEAEKWQNKASADNSQLIILRQEKLKLEQLLKKTTLENVKETEAPKHGVNDQELKRLQAQTQILETQVKDSSLKITNLEAKLAEAQKPQKPVATGDESSKVKLSQLENSVKKLTQDLVESRNQLGEAKKETNKLRQDKTALQNQLDKLKKEADKGKPALPKKPGGKAA